MEKRMELCMRAEGFLPWNTWVRTFMAVLGVAASGCSNPEDTGPGLSFPRGQEAGPGGGTTLPVILAQADVASGASQSVFIVSATDLPSAGTNQQQLRFSRSSVGYTFDTVDRQRREFTLRSGQSRTLAQLIRDVRGYFDAILAGAAEGSGVGKLGDVRFGGEAQFFSVGGGLRIVFLDGEGRPTESIELSGADLRVYRDLLDEAAGR